MLRCVHFVGSKVDQGGKFVALSLVGGAARCDLGLSELICLGGGLALRLLAHL